MADSVTDTKMAELAHTVRAKDQEIASLRKKIEQIRFDHSSEVYDLHEEIQILREALKNYEQSANMDYHGLHEQLQDVEMEDGNPLSDDSMNQQNHQVSYEAEPSVDSTLQADQEPYAQMGVNTAPNEVLDQQARQGVDDLQASVETTSQVNQESHAQSVFLGPNRFHQVSVSHQPLKFHANSGVEIPMDDYQTSKYLPPNGLSTEGLEAYILSTVGSDYDPIWYQRIGINGQLTTPSRSARKLNDFFRKVFQIGDQFCVNIQLDNLWTQRYATVKSFKPNVLFIEPSRNGSPGLNYEVVASLKKLYNAILQEHTGTATATYAGHAEYDKVHVYRQGVDMGNLGTIRQWFHLWTEDFDLWAVKTGKFHLRSARCPVNQKSLTWSRGLWFEKYQDGTRVCTNQMLNGNRMTAAGQAERKKLKEGGV